MQTRFLRWVSTAGRRGIQWGRVSDAGSSSRASSLTAPTTPARSQKYCPWSAVALQLPGLQTHTHWCQCRGSCMARALGLALVRGFQGSLACEHKHLRGRARTHVALQRPPRQHHLRAPGGARFAPRLSPSPRLLRPRMRERWPTFSAAHAQSSDTRLPSLSLRRILSRPAHRRRRRRRRRRLSPARPPRFSPLRSPLHFAAKMPRIMIKGGVWRNTEVGPSRTLPIPTGPVNGRRFYTRAHAPKRARESCACTYRGRRLGDVRMRFVCLYWAAFLPCGQTQLRSLGLTWEIKGFLVPL